MAQRFYRELQRLLLVSLFFSFIMMFTRLAFVALRHKYWEFSFSELGSIIYYGSWIDWRYLHLPILIFFVFVTLPALFPFSSNRWIHRLSIGIAGLWSFLFITVGVIRAIYFGYFKSTFNHFIFQTRTEDPELILSAVHHDYPFWLILPAIFLATAVFYLLWHYIDREWFAYWPGSFEGSISITASLLLFLLPVLSYASSTYDRECEKPTFTWETVDTLPVSPFAREAILNDFESFVRAQELYKTYWRDGIEETSTEELQKQFDLIHPVPTPERFNSVELYTRREAHGALIAKPTHIFIILGESYSQWPLLDKYSSYHLVDGTKSIINQSNSLWVKPFISNSTYTSAALIPVITGLTGIKTSPLHEPETFKTIYATSLAPQMGNLGYQTHFWYGGPGSWEQIRPFILAQGFKGFHGVGDPGMPPAEKLSYWGAPDRDLFDSILSTLPDRPTVNVILTTSNHSPYYIDLEKEGFPKEALIAALPEKWKDDNDLVRQLGHLWYADREMNRFITEMKKKHPDSLFIITGDHPDRITSKPAEGLFEWETIPLILHGPGIHPGLVSDDTAGGQVNIIPTLIELIAPRGFTYYSLAPSLTGGAKQGFGSQYWLTRTQIGYREKEIVEPIPIPADYTSYTRNANWEEGLITYSWWRINRGRFLEKPPEGSQ